MSKDGKVDPDTSPWYSSPRTGLSVCHYCGHPFEIGWDAVKQHHQGCPWLTAYLKEAAIPDGKPGLLTE